MSTNLANLLLPVTFTDNALKELHLLHEKQENGKNATLRIGVEGGGCSGMNYVLAFDEMKPGDMEFEIDGIKILMNKTHQLYLYGMQIDWQGGLNSRGFTFSNPNATSTCGCGTSFAV